MFAHGQLTRCREHKTALLQHSAAHRSLLVKETQNLRPIAGWMDTGIAVARKARASWLVWAPLLFLRPTRKQGSIGFVHKLAQGLSLARSILAIWRSWSYGNLPHQATARSWFTRVRVQRRTS